MVNRFKILFTTTLLLSVFHNADAAKNKPKAEMGEEIRKGSNEEESQEEDDENLEEPVIFVDPTLSSEIRKKLRYTANIGGGLYYSKLLMAAEVGYFINSQFLLNLKYVFMETTSTKHDNELDKDISYDSGSGSAVELSVKHFPGNSFYLRGGLYYRDQEIVERDIDDGGFIQFSSNRNATGKVRDIGAFLAVGNQWQWSQFTLGCDWFGYSSSLIKWKYTNEGEGQAAYLNNIRLLHLHVGASF